MKGHEYIETQEERDIDKFSREFAEIKNNSPKIIGLGVGIPMKPIIGLTSDTQIKSNLIITYQSIMPCLHDQCNECHGSGKKQDGSPCIHYLSCNCPKCAPHY